MIGEVAIFYPRGSFMNEVREKERKNLLKNQSTTTQPGGLDTVFIFAKIATSIISAQTG
jgi:hypothetical protein